MFYRSFSLPCVSSRACWFFLVTLVFFVSALPVSAQTTKPFVFTGATLNNGPAIAVFTRDDATGILTPVPNSPFPVREAPTSFALDVQARFLFAACAGRICLYQLNKDTGAVSEVPNSPFSATTTTNPIFLAAENSGTYLYVVNGVIDIGTSSAGSTDVFLVDAANLNLNPRQNISSDHFVITAALDPRSSTLYEYLGLDTLPGSNDQDAVIAIYSLNSSAGILAPQKNMDIGVMPTKMIIDPQAQYLAGSYGQVEDESDLFSLVTPLAPTPVSHVTFQQFRGGRISFNNSGTIFYSFDGANIRIFDSATGAELPSSPLPPSNAEASFDNWVLDPTGPFVYVMTPNGIVGYLLDPTTGLPSQPVALASPFGSGVVTGPVFFARTTDQVLAPTPAVSFTPGAINFNVVTVGQTSSPQQISILSAGSKLLTITVPLGLSGPNVADFAETDDCAPLPLILPVQKSCTATITYSPHTAGVSSQASLVVPDDAAGSPQMVALTGTGLAPAPAFTLLPASFSFPTTTQGTSSMPQSISLTSSGTSTLQITSVALAGGNTADYSLSSNCTGTFAVAATCSITVTFSPLAPGVRETSVAIASDAANSAVTNINVTANATAAATLSAAPAGSTTASISAGQTAQYNLQANPGSGFSGSITFTCSGLPFAATCNVPASVAVTNGTIAPFSISISTLSAAQFIPFRFPPVSRPPFSQLRLISLFAPPILVMLLVLLAFLLASNRNAVRPRRLLPSAAFVVPLTLLAAFAIGCGGGNSQPPTPQTAATPAIQPAGGTFSTGFPTVSITDSTPGAAVHYTLDGSAPTASSQLYSAPFIVNSPVTVQAVAIAAGFSSSAAASAVFKFQTPSGTSTITVMPTATATGSNKSLSLPPLQLTLTVK